MQILDRVKGIRTQEHERLRGAVFQLDTLLRELLEEEEKELARASAPRFDSWGERVNSPTPTPTRKRTVQPIALCWRPLEESLLARLDRWEEQILPLCRRWAEGQPSEVPLQEEAIAMMDGRTRVEALLREFRAQVLFFDLLKEPTRQLVVALEACDRVEEDEIFPSLISGTPDVAPTSSRRPVSSDDIAKNLRSKVVPRPPEPPPKRGISRWLGWGK